MVRSSSAPLRRTSSRAAAISPTAMVVADTYSDSEPTPRDTCATEPSMASTAACTATTPPCWPSAPCRTRSPMALASRAPCDTPWLAACTSITSTFSPSAMRRKSLASSPTSSREVADGVVVRSPEAMRPAARPSTRSGWVMERAATKAISAVAM